MRVLGVDPGSRFMGWGVVEQQRSRLAHVGHGVIRVDARAPLEQRLKVLYETLSESLRRHQPQAVAVEGIFTFRNARSALVLGHARGVALLAAAQAGLAVHEYPPARVKRAVGVSGAADKDAVARMVCTFLKLESLERSDASDALAVALCHLNHGRAAQPRAAGPAALSQRPRSEREALAERLKPSYRRPEAG